MSKNKKSKSPVTGQEYQASSEPRYTGIPSFMRSPIATSLDALNIALVGVPYDGGVTNRAGARHGPREMRNQSSLMRGYHHVTRVNPFEQASIADVGDVIFSEQFNHQAVVDDITNFFSLIKKAGVIPLSAGGDHSITYPIFRGIAKDGPIGMIHIDAHTDTWGEIWGNKFHHGSPFRLAVEDGLLDPKRTIQIGIRGAQNFYGVEPDISTFGTLLLDIFSGLVYTGCFNKELFRLSFSTDILFPTTPGIILDIESIKITAGVSPPDTI